MKNTNSFFSAFALLFVLLLTFVACDNVSNSATALTGQDKEKQVLEAMPTAIQLYTHLKEGLYNDTKELVSQENFDGYTDQTWLEFLKSQDNNYGTVLSYRMVDSKASLLPSGSKIVELIFEVKRKDKTIYEKINLVLPDGESAYQITGMFFSENREGIDSVG